MVIKRISRMMGLIVVLAGLLLSGCQPACVTKTEHSSFPLLWDCKYQSDCNPSGSLQIEDKGTALLLIKWDYDRDYDSKGQLVRYDDRSIFWPLYDIHSVKCGNTLETDGSILLFYKFGQKKN